MTFLVGAAADYSGATNLLAHLQKATDGTGLKLCQMDSKSNKKELEEVANQMMTSYFGKTPYTIEKLTPTSNPRTVEIETKATYPTAVLRAFGPQYSEVPVVANARCVGEPQTFEIALVLDTTGSMNRSSGGKSKMDAMKEAATKFVDAIFDHPIMSKNARMSLVPFAPSVALPPSSSKNASWLDQDGKASHHWLGIQGGKAAASALGATNRFRAFDQLKAAQRDWDWTGCLESAGYPNNTQDAAPSSANPDSYYVPMWAPDVAGDGGQAYREVPPGSGKWLLSYNSYIDDSNSLGYCQPTTDEATRTGRTCKYVEVKNPKTSNGYIPTGPNASCTTRPLTRLTPSKPTLINEIKALTPEGNTNIHEGFAWGWRTLSPKSVFNPDPAPYGKLFNNKVVVLMTDGMNTWGENSMNPTTKSVYSAYGYFKNPDGSTPNNRLPPGNANPMNEAQARAAMDALTLETCTNARKENVMIYTVGFSVPGDLIDQKGLDLLKACAGSDSRAYVAGNATEIVEVFEKIAQSIGNLRLTR